MKRRNFFAGLIGLIAAGTTGKVFGTYKAPPTWYTDALKRYGNPRMIVTPGRNVYEYGPEKFGRIKINEDPIANKCRVWLDGREVSRDCFEADDINGYVRVYKRNAQGRFYLQHSLDCPDVNGTTRDWIRNGYGKLEEVHKGCDHVAQERLTGHVTIKPLDDLNEQQRRTINRWRGITTGRAYLKTRL